MSKHPPHGEHVEKRFHSLLQQLRDEYEQLLKDYEEEVKIADAATHKAAALGRQLACLPEQPPTSPRGHITGFSSNSDDNSDGDETLPPAVKRAIHDDVDCDDETLPPAVKRAIHDDNDNDVEDVPPAVKRASHICGASRKGTSARSSLIGSSKDAPITISSVSSYKGNGTSKEPSPVSAIHADKKQEVHREDSPLTLFSDLDSDDRRSHDSSSEDSVDEVKAHLKFRPCTPPLKKRESTESLCSAFQILPGAAVTLDEHDHIIPPSPIDCAHIVPPQSVESRDKMGSPTPPTPCDSNLTSVQGDEKVSDHCSEKTPSSRAGLGVPGLFTTGIKRMSNRLEAALQPSLTPSGGNVLSGVLGFKRKSKVGNATNDMATENANKKPERKISFHSSVTLGNLDEVFRPAEKQFKARPEWQGTETKNNSDKGHLRSISLGAPIRLSDGDQSVLPAEDGLPEPVLSRLIRSSEECWLDTFVMSPNTHFNFLWDLLSMCFIGYDCVMIPFQVFDPSDLWLTLILGWVSAVFWSCDIVRTIFTGYYSKGDVIMYFKTIVRNYIMTWFALDSAISSFDWLYLTTKSFNNSGFNDGGLGFLKLLRSFRALRLLRSVKMARIMKAIEDRITSEPKSVLFNVCKLFVLLVLLNHFLACMWYRIGTWSDDENIANWVEEYLSREDSIWYQYTTSYHWSLTQFTPASINVQPRNVWERCFGVLVLLFALISVSSFVSGITSAVMVLRNLSTAKSKEFWKLRRYLRESEVPSALSLRIQRYCDFAWQSQQTKLQEHSVHALSLLSSCLRGDLNTAIFEPTLWSHPLFVLFSKTTPDVMRRICNTAVERATLLQGDSLFVAGDALAHCFVTVSKGENTTYFVEQQEGKRHEEKVPVYTWICESALWCEWSAVGTVIANRDCELVRIAADTFAAAVKSDSSATLEAEAYSRGYVHGLNRLTKNGKTDLFASTLLEGLWFRLLNEFNVKRAEQRRHSSISMSASLSGSSGAVAIPPDFKKDKHKLKALSLISE